MNNNSRIKLEAEQDFEAKVPENEQWQLLITRVENGYYIKAPNEQPYVIQENEKDELKDHEELLWYIMEYFNFGGSKHDLERLRIIREK